MVEIVTHGTLDHAELAEYGLSPDDLAVFSSNVNPFGPAPAALDAVAKAVTAPNLTHYPDRLSSELRQILADYHHLPPEAVVVGNGTADLMWLVGVLYLKAVEPGKVVVLSPTFGEYENIASLADTSIRTIALPGWTQTQGASSAASDARPGYEPSSRTLADCLDELRIAEPEVVFLCNPNNPTGELFSKEEVEQFLQAAPQAMWIIDEAYMEFAQDAWSAAQLLADARVIEGQVIVLRSMTKDFSLGGVRLGYLLAETEIAQAVQVAQSPWNVNIFAQVAGVASMQSLEWRAEALTDLRTETEWLRGEFEKLGLAPRVTTTNYFLTPIPNPGELRAHLLKSGLLIRDCTSFGLSTYFRVATQKREENQRLIEALRAYFDR